MFIELNFLLLVLHRFEKGGRLLRAHLTFLFRFRFSDFPGRGSLRFFFARAFHLSGQRLARRAGRVRVWFFAVAAVLAVSGRWSWRRHISRGW